MKTHKEEVEGLWEQIEELAEAMDAHREANAQLEDELEEATRELAEVRRTLDDYRVAHIRSLKTGVDEHAHVEGGG